MSEPNADAAPPRSAAPEDTGENASGGNGSPEELVCDFCGESTSTVRRVALDGPYERLRTPHRVRYACGPCSERKDRDRAGSEGAAGG